MAESVCVRELGKRSLIKSLRQLFLRQHLRDVRSNVVIVVDATVGKHVQLPWGVFPITLGSMFNYPVEYFQLPSGV